jgi:hypothetical protein
MTLPMKLVYEIDWERLASRVDEIPDEIHEILRLFDGRRTVRQVLQKCAFVDKEARAVVEKLKRESLIVEARTAQAKRAARHDDAELRGWLAAGASARPPFGWIAAGAAVVLVGVIVAVTRVSVPPAAISATVAAAPATTTPAPVAAPAETPPAPAAAAPAPVAVATSAAAWAAAPAPAAPEPAPGAAHAPVAPAAKAVAAQAEKPAAPANADVAKLVELARKQLDRGAVKKALANATHAAELDPNQAEAFVIIGVAQQQNERNADARSAYQRYLALAPRGQYASEIRSVLRTLR